MARRTQEDSLLTRARLLDAAESVFLEKGVVAASLEDIAKLAGVTRGALYHHFVNKADIFTAMHERICMPYDDTLTKILSDKSPLPKLKKFYIETLSKLESDVKTRNVITILMLKCGQCEASASSLERLQANKMAMEKKLTSIFEKLKKENKLYPDVVPKIAAQSLKTFVTGIFWEYLQNPKKYNLKKAAPQMIESFFRGLVKK